MTLRLVTTEGLLALGDAPQSGLGCLRCGLAAQVVLDSPFGTTAVCVPCLERLVAEALTRGAPRTTATHWRQASRDYGWPGDALVVDLWAPHGRDIPAAWMARFDHIPEFERRKALQREDG